MSYDDWAVVVAQRVERLLLIPEILSSNPTIGKISIFINYQMYRKENLKEKEAGGKAIYTNKVLRPVPGQSSARGSAWTTRTCQTRSWRSRQRCCPCQWSRYRTTRSGTQKSSYNDVAKNFARTFGQLETDLGRPIWFLITFSVWRKHRQACHG